MSNNIAITKILTPFNFSNGNVDRIKYIVIHYVGATGGARANCNYYAGQYLGASAHYYVDFDGSFFQSVEDKNIAWHCGTSSGYKHPSCRNSNSIGIELCVRNKGSKDSTSKDWYFEDATVKAGIELTKYLMKKYNVPADRVIRHNDVTGKICPNPFVYNHTKHTWTKFKTALTAKEEVITPGWVRAVDGIRWWYRRADGSYPANKWCIIDRRWYLFDEEGYMLTGWQKWNSATQKRELGRLYYLDESEGLAGGCWHDTGAGDGSMELWYLDKPNDI